MYDPHNCNLEQGIYVKEHTKNMLVNVVGGINNPEDSDRLIAEGKIDFISIAKQIWADPKFGHKCATGQSEDIQRCVRCIYCAAGTPDKEDWDVIAPPFGRRIEVDPETGKEKKLVREGLCTVNPEYGLIMPEGGWPEVTKAKKVLVVGGGIAGMTAALELANQGFECFLIEKEKELGGTLREIYYTLEGDDVQELLKNTLKKIKDNKLIHVFTNAELKEINGFVGNFKTFYTVNFRAGMQCDAIIGFNRIHQFFYK